MKSQAKSERGVRKGEEKEKKRKRPEKVTVSFQLLTGSSPETKGTKMLLPTKKRGTAATTC